MGKIKAEIYSCNKDTYSPICYEVISLAFLKLNRSIKREDIEINIIDLSENGTKEIQQQRNPNGDHARVIKVYEDNEMVFLIGLSNTNYDEDIRLERLNTNRKDTFGKNNYHANTYLLQGINKIFDKFLQYKEKHQKLSLLFYLLDIDQTYPHNKFNLMTYRMLSTIGFSILNINRIQFTEFKKYGFIPSKDFDIKYLSFNKLMNDKIAISSTNKGNIPGYLKCVETLINEDSEQYKVEKYIYTFKGLGAQAYDSFLWLWTLKKLADSERIKIEFHFSIENYNFSSKNKKTKQTKTLPNPVKELLTKVGIDITYESTDEILQNERIEIDSHYRRMITSGEIRNQEMFRNNLRQKGILTKCAVCDCEIEGLLDAAHIWGIKEIKQEDGRKLISFINSTSLRELFLNIKNQEIEFKRFVLANSGDNGIWLCKLHHTAFDRFYFSFNENNGMLYQFEIEDKNYQSLIASLGINELTLDKKIINENTKAFLTKRNSISLKPFLNHSKV